MHPASIPHDERIAAQPRPRRVPPMDPASGAFAPLNPRPLFRRRLRPDALRPLDTRPCHGGQPSADWMRAMVPPLETALVEAYTCRSFRAAILHRSGSKAAHTRRAVTRRCARHTAAPPCHSYKDKGNCPDRRRCWREWLAAPTRRHSGGVAPLRLVAHLPCVLCARFGESARALERRPDARR